MKQSATNLHDSDQHLLEQMAQGNADAFTTLYHRYWESLFLMSSRMLRSTEVAEDIIHDVFLALWNRRQQLAIDSLEAYLVTSVRYAVIRYIQRNITHRDYLAMLTETQVSELSGTPELQLQLKQLQQVIDTAVKNMPTRMQEVYRLSREENLSRKEIAERLGIAEFTVKKQMQSALALIRKAIAQVPGSLIVLLLSLFEKKF